MSNAHKGLEYASGGFDHRHALKFLFSHELPVMREQRGMLGKIAGGWQITGFYQGYSGHPIEIFSSRARFKGNARDANGFLENVGGDYNLDGLANDHPDFMGVNTTGYYSNQSPADGIFADNNPIGCGSPGAQSTNTADCNAAFGVTTPNLFFVNPPGTGVRFGRLGRNVFHGPWFNGFDAGLFKNFQVSERWKLQFRAEALNLPNHPSFDGISGDLNSASNFGKAQCTVGDANCPAATAPARRFQLGMRLLF